MLIRKILAQKFIFESDLITDIIHIKPTNVRSKRQEERPNKQCKRQRYQKKTREAIRTKRQANKQTDSECSFSGLSTTNGNLNNIKKSINLT